MLVLAGLLEIRSAGVNADPLNSLGVDLDRTIGKGGQVVPFRVDKLRRLDQDLVRFVRIKDRRIEPGGCRNYDSRICGIENEIASGEQNFARC